MRLKRRGRSERSERFSLSADTGGRILYGLLDCVDGDDNKRRHGGGGTIAVIYVV